MNKNNCVIRKDIRLTKKEASKARLHGFISREALAQAGDPIVKDVPYGMAHRMNTYCKMEVNTYDNEWVFIDYGDTDNLYKAYTATKPNEIENNNTPIVEKQIVVDDAINIKESISMTEFHEEEDEPVEEDSTVEEEEVLESEEVSEEDTTNDEEETVEEENTIPPLASTLMPGTNTIDTETPLHTVEEVSPSQNNNSNKYYNNYKKKRR